MLVACNEGATAALHRCSADGALLHTLRWPGEIDDLDITADGLVAAGGSFGVRVFNASLDHEHTQRRVTYSGSATVRIASDPHGRLAVAIGNVITLYDTNGSALTSVDMTTQFGSDRNLADVACDSHHVYAGGYRQAASNLQTPFLYALSPAALSNRIWRCYDYWQSFVTACVPYALTSGSQLRRIECARNGRLYILGHADGGVSSFNLHGSIPPSNSGTDATYVTRVEIDNYNRLFNSNASRKTFFAEIDAARGVAVRGQWLVPRCSPTGSNTRNYIPDGVSIYRNVCYSNGFAGIQYNTGRNAPSKIMNNVCDASYHSGIYLVNLSGSTTEGQDVELVNNLLLNGGRFGMTLDMHGITNVPAGFVVDYNAYRGNWRA